MFCSNCQEVLSSEGEWVVCGMCESTYHYDCSVREAKWRNMSVGQRSKWSCAKCKSGASTPRSNSVPSTPNNESFIGNDLKALLLQMNAKLDTLDQVKRSVDTMKDSLEFLSGKYDELLQEVKGYRESNVVLRKEIEDLREDCARKDDEVWDLTRRLNTLEQYGRGVNLEIHGVQELPNESMDAVLKNTASALELPYNPADFQAAHRLPSRDKKKTATVLVQFVNKSTKQTWLREGRRKKLLSKDIIGTSNQRVFFNENLTPFYSKLFRETKSVARERNYQFVWVKNGAIKVKKSEAARQTFTISSYGDLRQIV